MFFYVFKTNEGYVKCSSLEDIQIVTLDKASVFPKLEPDYINKVVCEGEKIGLTHIRIAKLVLTEMDNYSKEEACV